MRRTIHRLAERITSQNSGNSNPAMAYFTPSTISPEDYMACKKKRKRK